MKRKSKIYHGSRSSTVIEFVTNIIEGKVLGERRRRRTEKPYFEDIKHSMQIDMYNT